MTQFKKMVALRFFAENALLFLLQFMGLMFGSFFFATGSACAFVLMRGNTILPGIFLGGLFAYLSSGSSLYVAFACSSVLMLQVFSFRWLTNRYILPTLMFNHLSSYLQFILMTVLLTAASSQLLNIICHTAFFFPWWLSNLNGIFIVTFAIATLDMYFPQAPQLRALNKIPLIIAYALLAMASMTLVLTHDPLFIAMLAAFVLAMMIMLAFKYGWCGVVAANFMIGLIFALAAYIYVSDTMILLEILLLMVSWLGLGLSIVKAGL